MKPDNEYRPWVVYMIAENSNKEVARYRLRNDAEAHRQALTRLLPNGRFRVEFEEPKVSLR